MIGRIKGILIEKLAPEILIEASGVGYEIQVPMTSFYQLPELGQTATIYTHFVVREDAQLLFGFATKTERTLFRELIKANGVGPKLALTILSGMSATQFAQCVSQNDVTSLVKLPGVGKKTAERLLVEMGDKMEKLFGNLDGLDMPDADNVPQETLSQSNGNKQEAISALIALGYKQPQASKAVGQIFSKEKSSESLIREALKSML
jgi:Holliday junction DNA helicase RuvA